MQGFPTLTVECSAWLRIRTADGEIGTTAATSLGGVGALFFLLACASRLFLVRDFFPGLFAPFRDFWCPYVPVCGIRQIRRRRANSQFYVVFCS